MNQIRFFLCFAPLLILIARNGAESISDTQSRCIGKCADTGNHGASPVCGSDYVTYGSQCHLNCQNAEDKQTKKASDGKCPKPPQCDCNGWGYGSVINPLCGMDGEFFSNPCAAYCSPTTISYKTKTGC